MSQPACRGRYPRIVTAHGAQARQFLLSCCSETCFFESLLLAAKIEDIMDDGGNVAKRAHSADVRLLALAPISLWFLSALGASAATGSQAQHDGMTIANHHHHLETEVGGGAVSSWNAEMRSSDSIYNYRDRPHGSSPGSGANCYIRGSYPAISSNQWRYAQHREDRATRRLLVQVGKPGLPRTPPRVHYL